MTRSTLLLISPRTEFRHALTRQLEAGGARVVQVALAQVRPALVRVQPHLVLLDSPAQEVAGLAACREVRASYQGVLVCLVDDSAQPLRSLALSLGADVCLARSEDSGLIVAQIKALLRRFQTQQRAVVYRFGCLLIDASRRDAYVSGHATGLSTVEFDLLWTLVCRAGGVVPREELYSTLYDTPYNGYDRGVDLHVSRIRRKIGDDPQHPTYLKTVRGVGYQFVCADDAPNPLQTVTPS